MNLNKVLFATLLTILSLSFSSKSSAKAETSTEYQQVIDVAYTYFNGAAKGDQQLLAQAFDLENGHIKMIRKNKETGEETINTMLLNDFAKVFKQATKDTWQAKVLSVDIVENTMAMVKLDFDTPKTHYIDYLVMYKRNGQWKIVNKTFYAQSK